MRAATLTGSRVGVCLFRGSPARILPQTRQAPIASVFALAAASWARAARLASLRMHPGWFRRACRILPAEIGSVNLKHLSLHKLSVLNVHGTDPGVN